MLSNTIRNQDGVKLFQMKVCRCVQLLITYNIQYIHFINVLLILFLVMVG